MPRFPDKVLIDEQRVKGEFEQINHEFNVASMLAFEVEARSLYDETDHLESKLAKGCYAFTKAARDFRALLMEVNDETNKIVSEATRNQPKE